MVYSGFVIAINLLAVFTKKAQTIDITVPALLLSVLAAIWYFIGWF